MPFRINVKDTMGSRNANALASTVFRRIIGMWDAARRWNSAAAARKMPPAINDPAANDSWCWRTVMATGTAAQLLQGLLAVAFPIKSEALGGPFTQLISQAPSTVMKRRAPSF